MKTSHPEEREAKNTLKPKHPSGPCFLIFKIILSLCLVSILPKLPVRVDSHVFLAAPKETGRVSKTVEEIAVMWMLWPQKWAQVWEDRGSCHFSSP